MLTLGLQISTTNPFESCFRMSQITPHEALIHIMVTMSAADRSMTDKELAKIGNIIRSLPAFSDYDSGMLVETAAACGLILQEENGLQTVIANALEVLPQHLHETAYALAVEVAAADLKLEQEELRLLQILRDRMRLDRLACAAIERGARARHQSI